ncbi:aldehyde dehydrogenase (NAD+) [Variovorax boronicumulans]|uniref:aldehyde dehydrogenase (NAD(+)) n=1 Tax=Variovorax boronicumulans TaxID=436515 RepID=A0AAW8D2Q2_9BURK|nr:aldehyde dehydrogenase family protein [Variovorax boronicumulans]MDP9894499.1 aldehyde dehydrogenase (NAD+) [Variovorax boronicumulans]MDQ0054318.1 aldehyde dehydrogenase (NAD+) [Variovorax boronicumulans]
MWNIDQAYIDGAFVPVQGTERLDIANPATEQSIGTVTLANRDDARRAIAAANRAQPGMASSTRAERIEMLRRLEAAVLARTDEIRDATIEEYGGPLSRSQWVSNYASQCFASTAQVLRDYAFERRLGEATVVMEPVGVSGLIAPWNSAAGSICSKLASAIAAGCASVIKPSELGPLQAQVVTQALHDAALPAGAVNVLLGRGANVGDEIATSAGIAKISFTGSTQTGKLIARAGLDTMKRVSLALSGKSATVVLDDADMPTVLPMALNAAFMNNGQACVAGTRLLIPKTRMADAIERIRAIVAAMRVADPRDPATAVGPLASKAQFERVQHFIRRGLAEGATLVAGGEGRPEGLDKGWFVRPTVFAGVHNDMEIAREEIFGPVLSVIGYGDEAEAIAIANDSPYGLQAYVFSSQPQRALRVAAQLRAGSVLVNRIAPELIAPFGGVRQSGIGREFGVFGMEAFLEPKTIAAADGPAPT